MSSIQTSSYLKNTSFSSFLDLARWVAAFIVLIGHARGLLFFGWGDLSSEERGIFSIPWYFISGLFNEAVIVFFVLSGYLVALTILRNDKFEDFSLRTFFIDRYTRLYIGFLPALVLTLMLDYVGISTLQIGGYYDGTQATIVKTLAGYSPFQANFTFSNFIGTLIMLQGFVVTPFGSNPPLWSIAYEFWFYSLFGLSIKLYILWKEPNKKIICLFWALVCFWISSLVLGAMFFVYLGIWLMGVSLAFIPALSKRFVIPCLLTFFSILVFFRLASDFKSLTYFNIFKNYITALSFCFLIGSMKTYEASWLVNMKRINAKFAGFSYSLYLIHYPILLFILSLTSTLMPSLLIFEGFAPNNPVGLLIYFSLICFCLLFSYIFSRLTESKTQVLRAIFHDKLPRRVHT